MSVTIYHNPRCSKSRQTLALLEKRGISPKIVKYLVDPPDAATLKGVIKKLGVSPRDLLRSKEEPYKALDLDAEDVSNDAIIEAMVQHPILIERPIVVAGSKAAIGRPPEAVLDILP